jgi:serine/threonine-protein phosphatase 2A regulatory subunit B
MSRVKEFRSHSPGSFLSEFDCLKNLEVEERINVLQWGRHTNAGLYLLATNDKVRLFSNLFVHSALRRSSTGRCLTGKRSERPSPPCRGPEYERFLSLLSSLFFLFSPRTACSHDPTQGQIAIPKLQPYQNVTCATPKRAFSNAHDYHINSISINSDGATREAEHVAYYDS